MKNVNRKIEYERRKLYKDYVYKSPYSKYNKQRIDYILENVYKRQLKIFNKNEQKVIDRLKLHGIAPTQQKLIPIAQSGGKLEHLYIADMIIGSTIIEVDGPQHEKSKEWDEERDKLTSELGYSTIRIPTSDLSSESIDEYLQFLY